ncbi:MAG: phospholipid/cholesterol/gamma-HCH transport system substrate-binding protein [Actinomycetota bacterium]
MKRRVNINIVFFAFGFVVMLFWLASSVVSFKQVDKPYSLTANFENAFGVLKNAEVSYIGVPFGHVSGVKRVPNGVRITMSIERGRKIPAGSTANIQRKSAIGEQYIDFFPPPRAQAQPGLLKDGDRIPRDRTTVPLEFSEFLRSASALLAAVPPGAVGTIVHEAATGLDGRVDSLRALAVEGDKLSSVLAAKTEALDRLATNGGKLTSALTDHRASLGASLDNLAALNSALAGSKDDLSTLLEKGAPLTAQLADLVGNHKADLDCDLKVLEVVIDHATTPKMIDGLRALLTYAPPAFGAVWDARDIEADGVWVRVGAINALNSPPVQFNPPRAELSNSTPIAPPPSCVSPLPPSGISYSTASASKPAAPINANSAAIGMGLALATAALVVRSATKAVQ